MWSPSEMKKHFGEIDEYMATHIEKVLAASGDRTRVEALAAQVREDGYPQFADKLAEIAQ